MAKVKLKTKKSATKRFRVTKNGKVLTNKMGKRHILTKKSAKRKRRLSKHSTLKKCEVTKVVRMLPYSN
jgi:large subunit ribosomal protein L35